MLSVQCSCGCVTHCPQITHHRRLCATPCIPTAFLQKKKYCPFPALSSCRFLFLQKRTQLCAYLFGCILFHPDRLLALPSPFSELQPRLPESLQALVASCNPHLWSAWSFFNTLQNIQEGGGATRPTTDPHPMWLRSSSPLTSPFSLLSIYLHAEGKVPFSFFPAPGISGGRCRHFVPCRLRPSVCPFPEHSSGHTRRGLWVGLGGSVVSMSMA